MDIDGDGELTLEEFEQGLDDNRETQMAVRQGNDTTDIMKLLDEYFKKFQKEMRDAFAELGIKDDDGDDLGLDQTNLQIILSNISGLSADEQRFVLTAMYQYDPNGDGLISYDEFVQGIEEFKKGNIGNLPVSSNNEQEAI